MTFGISAKARPINKIIGWSIIGVPLAVLFLWGLFFLRPEPIAPASVYGCYTAPDAPALLIRHDAIHIIEPARRKFSYVAEASKTSYQLSVEPALALSRQSNGRYKFVDREGIGYFWPLLPAGGKNRNRVRHPKEYAGQFEVAAIGNAVVYTRTSEPSACRDVR